MVRRECLVLPRFLNLRNHLDSESMGGQIDQGSSSNEVYRRFQRGNLLLSLGHIRYMTLFSAPWLPISICFHRDWTGVFLVQHHSKMADSRLTVVQSAVLIGELFLTSLLSAFESLDFKHEWPCKCHYGRTIALQLQVFPCINTLLVCSFTAFTYIGQYSGMTSGPSLQEYSM